MSTVENGLGIHNENCDCGCTENTPLLRGGVGVGLVSGEAYESPLNINLLIEKSIKRIYKHKIKEGKVDADLVLANYEKLKEGLNDGLTGKIEKLEFGSSGHRMYLNMRHNVFVTAAFKNYHNTEEMKAQLFNPDGTLRTWPQFHKAAKPLAEVYNKNYLQAEWSTAQASARMGSQWHKFVARGGKLMYETIGDARVRDEHALLNGTVKAVTDVFWDKYYPPNGWRCRCHVRWLADDNADVEPKGLPDLKPMFQHNVGKSGEVFTKASPYFNIPAKDDKYAQKLFGMLPKMPQDVIEVESKIRLYNVLIKEASWKLKSVNLERGTFVFQHVNADLNGLADNIENAIMIATNFDEYVLVLEHIEPIGDEAKALRKRPEFDINGTKGDLRTPDPKKYTSITTAIKNGFEAKQKQLVDTLMINMVKDEPIAQIVEGVRLGFQKARKINTLYLRRGKKVVKITREKYLDGSYIKQINELY